MGNSHVTIAAPVMLPVSTREAMIMLQQVGSGSSPYHSPWTALTDGEFVDMPCHLKHAASNSIYFASV